MSFEIDWASLIVGNKCTVFALFYFVFEGNFPSTSPWGEGGGLYLEGPFGGLYLEGLIFEILRFSAQRQPPKYLLLCAEQFQTAFTIFAFCLRQIIL